MKPTKKIILSIAIVTFISIIGVTSVIGSVTANQGAKVSVTEIPGPVQQKKKDPEKGKAEKAQKAQEKAKEKRLQSQKKTKKEMAKIKMMNKKVSQDKKSSIATL